MQLTLLRKNIKTLTTEACTACHIHNAANRKKGTYRSWFPFSVYAVTLFLQCCQHLNLNQSAFRQSLNGNG